jgi:chromate transporter
METTDPLPQSAALAPPSNLSRPSMTRLLATWLRIGATSYGGGAVVQYLIQEHFIHKHKWLSAEEYTRILATCQITPGLTLIAITITIGQRFGGWRGIAISLAGLILPSASITIAMTAVYASVRDLPAVQAALRAVFASIVGISLATSWRNTAPILRGSRQRGPATFTTALAILGGSALLFVLFNPPVIFLYALGGLAGAFVYWQVHQRRSRG